MKTAIGLIGIGALFWMISAYNSEESMAAPTIVFLLAIIATLAGPDVKSA